MLGIRDDGSFSGNLGSCNPATRNGQAFADHAYAVALVDEARDLELRNYADLVEIVRYMQSRNAVLPMTRKIVALIASPSETGRGYQVNLGVRP